MKKKLSGPIKLMILLILSIVIFLGISVAGAAGSTSITWLLRPPPYEIRYSYIMPYVNVVAWGGVDKNVMYAGNTYGANTGNILDGIYRSVDYGVTWGYIGRVDEHENIHHLVVHPTKPNILFAGFNRTYYQGGIYRSEDSGDHWTSVFPYMVVEDIEIDPSNPSVMYATGLRAGAPPVNSIRSGLYKSIDEGQTWQYISTSYFSDIAVHPTSPNILFAMRRLAMKNSPQGVYRSEDAGNTWTQISDIREYQIIINQNNPDQMFIFGADYLGIWRTDDGGLNWRNVTSNLPRVVSNPSVQSAVLDPANPNTIWIGLKYAGMYVSYNSGENWQQVSNGIYALGPDSIQGPQCTSSDISNGQLIIACSGLVYLQSERETPQDTAVVTPTVTQTLTATATRTEQPPTATTIPISTVTATQTLTAAPSATTTPISTAITTQTLTAVPIATITPISNVAATRTLTAAPTATITPKLTVTPALTIALTSTPAPTVLQTPTFSVRTFTSVAAQDGWVLESSEFSKIGGSMNASAATFTIGDDAANRQYRAILSFNTASLPDSAVIQSVVLQIRQNGTPAGSNPFYGLGNLWVYIRTGTFGVGALQLRDFNAAASAAKVGAFNKIPSLDWYTATLNAAGRRNINKTGQTQLRLHFTLGDNNNHKADFMNFFSGNATSGKPLLVITYMVP